MSKYNTLVHIHNNELDINVPVKIHFFMNYSTALKFVENCPNDCIMTYNPGDNEYFVEEVI